MYLHDIINIAPTLIVAQITVANSQLPIAALPVSKTLVCQLFLPPSILDYLVISITENYSIIFVFITNTPFLFLIFVLL